MVRACGCPAIFTRQSRIAFPTFVQIHMTNRPQTAGVGLLGLGIGPTHGAFQPVFAPMKSQVKSCNAQATLWKRGSRLKMLGVVSLQLALSCVGQQPLPNTELLTLEGDLSAQMVAGIQKFLVEQTDRSFVERQRHWKRDFFSREAYESSVQPNRDRFQRILGVVDQRLPVTKLEIVSFTDTPALVAETGLF